MVVIKIPGESLFHAKSTTGCQRFRPPAPGLRTRRIDCAVVQVWIKDDHQFVFAHRRVLSFLWLNQRGTDAIAAMSTLAPSAGQTASACLRADSRNLACKAHTPARSIVSQRLLRAVPR